MGLTQGAGVEPTKRRATLVDYKSTGLSDAQTLRIVRAVKQGKRRWFGRRAEESNLIRVARTADYKAAPGTSQMPSGIL